MRFDPIQLSPIKVTITTEEILADLTSPAPADAGAGAAIAEPGGRSGARPLLRPLV